MRNLIYHTAGRVSSILMLILFCVCMLRVLPADAEESLQHGINLSNWLANAKRQPIDARDMAEIHHAGFDHVRLPVDPEGLNLDTLDKAIALAANHHLRVILDMHPSPHYVQTLENDADAERSFIALWQSLAQHYNKTPAQELSFELLNEPQYYKTPERYQALMQKTVDAIHRINKSRTLIVDATEGASLKGLEKLEPLQGRHITYAFHFYEPYIITHQGIHQGFEKAMIRYFSRVPYPALLAGRSVESYAPDALNHRQAQEELDEYKIAGWDSAHIKERIAIAHNWAEKNHANVICTEFGVLRHTNDAASRYRWIKDVRTALEEEHIGFSLWDYTDLFGITTLHGETSTDPTDKSVRLADPARGSRAIDKDALAALGLVP